MPKRTRTRLRKRLSRSVIHPTMIACDVRLTAFGVVAFAMLVGFLIGRWLP